MKSKNSKITKSNEIRLNKFLAEAGVSSRRKADELISSGVVKVNKKVVTELGTLVKPSDFITVNGDPIKQIIKKVYILLNKPKDYISTTNDEKDRKTVLDLVNSKYRIFPVGRLDRNTTGVILLTNDGDISNKLLHPSNRVERVYVAGLDKDLNESDGKKISQGVELEDFTTSNCEVFIDLKDKKKVTIVIREGKNREIRKIFESLGYNVRKLDRKFYATLSYKGLNRGDYRHLTKNELLDLKKYLKLK